MRSIHIKLVRDLVMLKGQVIAIGLVMACGVATFVMSLSMLDSLTGTLNAYYEQNRFAQVFAHMKRAPRTLAERIAEIPGVAHVQTRVVESVTLDMPDLSAPASGQIVSLPDDPRSGLNLIYLRSGRFPEGSRSREVLVGQRFAEAHELNPGDTVSVVLNGRLEDLRVVGVGLSPEFVYLIGPGSILPENERFGVFWMNREELEAAYDMNGAFNDLLISLSPGASQPEVIDCVDVLIEPYGGLGAHGRDDQASHKFVDNEITELKGMTLIVPVIFLAVSAFLLNIVLTRMIATQREQIATLKALGYSRLEIGTHYVGFVLFITALAVVAGTLLGAWMGRGLTAVYIDFFDFPSFEYTLRTRVVVLGFVVSTVSAVLGVAQALRNAMRLPPAEAMRPLAPPSFKPTILERLGVHRALPTSVRMIVRQLERQPVRTALTMLGVALAAAILVVGSFSADALDFVLDTQFNHVQRYDIDVALTDVTDSTSLSTIRHMPGVRAVEPYRFLAVRIRHSHIERRIGLLGLASDDGLYGLIDMRGQPVSLPSSGVVLSSTLADVLGVTIGDKVTIEAMEGRRPTFQADVSGLIDDLTGLSAYMSLSEMNKHMREQNTIGGAYLLTDPAHSDDLYSELHDAPRVAAVNIKSAMVENFRETISRNIALMRPFTVGFSVVIALGVVYNSARISLSERSRDLATLRVLGYTKREIASIQLGELTIITLLSIPLGLVLGHLLAWWTVQATGSELVRIPFVLYPSTYTFAGIVIALASIASGMVVLRRTNRLDLVSVLKSGE